MAKKTAEKKPTPDNGNEKNENRVEVSSLEDLKNALASEENVPENRDGEEKAKKAGKKSGKSSVGGKKKKSGSKKSEKNASQASQSRGADGRFVKGVSGNPGGRPKKSDRLLEMGEYAEKKMFEMMQNPKTPRGIRVDLYKYVHDKAFGRATQAVDMEAKGKMDVTTSIKFEGALEEWSE